MDRHRSGYFMRAMRGVPSRRDVLRSLAGAGLGLGIVRFPDLAAAKKRKRKKKVKKAKPNEFGCLEVGDACTSADDCCSGVCEGKKGKRTCRAHDTGSCRQDGQLVPCNNRTNCGCYHTTAGSEVCAYLFGPSACVECRRDADCLALGFPPGSACGPSTNICDTSTACFAPCGSVMPEA